MKKKYFDKKTIPNFLTIFRIILVPIIVILLLISSENYIYTIKLWEEYKIHVNNLTFVAGILFLISSITDFLDGYLARKWNAISDFGKFWDPLSDKILVNSTLFCLASPNQNLLPIWIPILILIRDFIVDGLRLYMLQQGIVSAANIYGKIKTFTLIIGILFLIYFGSDVKITGKLYFWLCQNFLMYISTLLSIISATVYVWPIVKLKIKSVNKNKDI